MNYERPDLIDMIKNERRRQKVTQTELAQIVGCPQPSIVRIETKKLSPSLATLQKMCDALGVDIVIRKKTLIPKHFVIHSQINDDFIEIIYKRFKPYFIKTTIAYDLPLDFSPEEKYEESICIEKLKNDESHLIPAFERDIELNITTSYDLYFSFINCPFWLIGNAKTDNIPELVNKIVNEYVPSLLLLNEKTVQDLVNLIGNPNSKDLYTLDEYKAHLVKQYLDNLNSVQDLLQNIN